LNRPRGRAENVQWPRAAATADVDVEGDMTMGGRLGRKHLGVGLLGTAVLLGLVHHFLPMRRWPR
jgi:hypothetical protein